MSATKHVAVLKGGWSAEREVSLVTGKGCAEALRSHGYHVTEIDAGRDLADQILKAKPDVAFNALHGRWGEDGCVQGLLEILRVPYTHSGVLASALAMHKERGKAVFRAAGLPVAESVVVPRAQAALGHVMDPPYVIKPVSEGSSVGVFIIRAGDNRPPAELTSPDWNLGDEVMAERYIAGRELTCAVMGEEIFGVTEIIANTTFYDYEAKYAAGGSRHVIPAPIEPDVYAEVQRVTLAAHKALGCRGVSRADFRFDDTRPGKGELILLEVNTQPGMTPTSLVPELANLAGYSYAELVSWMVEDATCDR
ncbi:MAG: D-alanine--D-alanine ligase [Parvibaculum sp.]|uniref:D-alanine--D-alanine ligase n=1 Tax=Parvibaculum sp. TaxID=2024848 RepID=UPI0027255E1A|nr:D-alanine--D-alanine ligase [Parvibaculum sp.]MDO8839858.1 D-alanine--D-alanine ligase [Parvibaculum sp.]MDP2125213.1 D-alanine--D-alanine ligase [Parvibaculum sp.]